MDSTVIYTIGHSTRSLGELAGLLKAVAIRELVDVRSVPSSRRHPQFAAESLSRSLPAEGIAYAHERRLGGFRRPLAHSPNRGWEHRAFRGYADHMASEEFQSALAGLQARGREGTTCVMCAEAQWWRCHRRLLADALLARGWRVLHLGLGGEPVAHELTPFAVLTGDRGLVYPPLQTELQLGGLPQSGR